MSKLKSWNIHRNIFHASDLAIWPYIAKIEVWEDLGDFLPYFFIIYISTPDQPHSGLYVIITWERFDPDREYEEAQWTNLAPYGKAYGLQAWPDGAASVSCMYNRLCRYLCIKQDELYMAIYWSIYGYIWLYTPIHDYIWLYMLIYI